MRRDNGINLIMECPCHLSAVLGASFMSDARNAQSRIAAGGGLDARRTETGGCVLVLTIRA
jgi:hypothetical protein